MANTYTQLYFHIIIVVEGRRNLIQPEWKVDLYKYITGITTNKKQKLMVINGMPDHVHILLGSKPDFSLSDIMRDIKANSARYINEKKWTTTRFAWQKGFGAFTVGHSQVKMVAEYIERQEEHHGKQTFSQEYIEYLEANAVKYQPEYIFDEVK